VTSYGTVPGRGRVPHVEKLMINLDTALPLMCEYQLCSDRRARSPYQYRTCEHMPVPCRYVDNPPPGAYYGLHRWHAFCSENCMDLNLAEMGKRAQDTADRHRGQIGGNHTPGMRGTIR
jgi:hypothetical protein